MIVGTTGNDHLHGTNGVDTFDISQGGNDHVDAKNGADTILCGGALTNRDRIDGGADNDILILDGNYSTGLKFKANSLTNVEQFNLIAGHSYDLTMVDENALAGTTFSINGSTLLATDALIFDGSRETDARFIINGGAGDDVVKCGDGGASIGVGSGGNDTVTGGAGIDLISVGASFDSGDIFRGGGNTDFLLFAADYSAGLHLTKDMAREFEVFQLAGEFDYNMTIDNKVTAAGATLSIDARNVGAAHTVVFDGSTERDSILVIQDGQGDDVLTAGDMDDRFLMYEGGDDVVNGRDGEDVFEFKGMLDRQDEVDGGGDYDVLKLEGDYSAGIVFRGLTIHQIEEIQLVASGFAYSLTTDDGNVAAGETLVLNGLSANAAITFDGSAETDGMFDLTGGDADDTLTGGVNGDQLTGSGGNDRLNGFQGDDIITGGAGADKLNGGFGADIYILAQTSDSTGFACDTTLSFNASVDKFDLGTAVTGVDTKIVTGTLSDTSFDADLGTAVNGGNLAIGHAVLFDPDGGNQQSHIFLIVEANGVAGYQAGLDYVFQVDNAINMNLLAATNFI